MPCIWLLLLLFLFQGILVEGFNVQLMNRRFSYTFHHNLKGTFSLQERGTEEVAE